MSPRSLPLVFAAALLAIPAHAATPGLYLAWDDCASAGAANFQSDCQEDTEPAVLVCAFAVAEPLDDVLGLEAIVDVQHSTPTLPSWWRMVSGQCRDGTLSASGDFTGETACADPWLDLGGGAAFLEPGLPYGANQARITATYAVPSDQPRTLAAGTVYYGVRITLSHRNTSLCPGCAQGACLLLNGITLLRAGGARYEIETPGAPDANRATWAGGGGADCAAVPATRTTWGQIKSLYRL